MAKRFCDGLGDRDNPENELFPHLKLVAGIHPTKRLAGFERFFEMRHTVPERQGHMAKVADVRWLSLNEKCIAHAREKISSVPFFHHSQSRQAIQHNARGAQIGSRCTRDFFRALKTFVNKSEKIILESRVEDLAIGEVPQDAHQGTR